MRLAYFVQDVLDPAVERRVRMLQAGGAEVLLLGFRRSDESRVDVAGAEVVDLGRTHDGRLGERALTVAGQLIRSGRWASRLDDVDAVMARSLETLVLASAARSRGRFQGPLVYECLDVHPLMVANHLVGAGLRKVEHGLLAGCQLLIVSSPGFIERYFEPRHQVGRGHGPAPLLVENRRLRLAREGPPPRPQARGPAPAPPWQIGWFGVLRCSRSFEGLSRLAERRPDLLSLHMAGRPARHRLPQFDAVAGAVPGVTYSGPYAEQDLAALYDSVHFTWAADYSETGGNSEWLLPNRIYEGGWFGTPAIARQDTETGRWLQARGLGAILHDPIAELEGFLDALTREDYLRMRAALAHRPDSDFAADQADCIQLVRAIAGQIGAGGRPMA